MNLINESYIYSMFCGFAGIYLLAVLTFHGKYSPTRMLLLLCTGPILGLFSYMLSGVWLTSQELKYLAAFAGGFIGPHISKGIASISKAFSEDPIGTAKQVKDALKSWKSDK